MSKILTVTDLHIDYPRPGKPPFHAVRGVSFDVEENEIFGVVGESGCGKSTVAKALCGLIPTASGSFAFADTGRGGVQMIFQDAVGSLNPRKTIGSALEEVLKVCLGMPAPERRERIASLLDEVGLPAEVAQAYPRELSGGQCQRISVARALAVNPRVLIADEPVSALDVSVQARVLNLLADVRRRRSLTVILISHDLAVVRTICDRLIVMNRGEIAERGSAKTVFADPQHPYTQKLLAAVPDVATALARRSAAEENT